MDIIEACEGRIGRGAKKNPSGTCKKNRLFAIMEKYYSYDGVPVPVHGGVSFCEKFGKTFKDPQKKKEGERNVLPQKKKEGEKNVLPPQQRKDKKVSFREDREEERPKTDLQKIGGAAQKFCSSDGKIGARPPKFVVPSTILEVNLAAIAIELRVKVRGADMPPVQQELAFRCGRKCLDASHKIGFRMVALTLKKEFDKCYGPAWHCIVGRSFGSFVTHSPGGFLYFSMDKVSVLLFRTAVEPIEQ